MVGGQRIQTADVDPGNMGGVSLLNHNGQRDRVVRPGRDLVAEHPRLVETLRLVHPRDSPQVGVPGVEVKILLLGEGQPAGARDEKPILDRPFRYLASSFDVDALDFGLVGLLTGRAAPKNGGGDQQSRRHFAPSPMQCADSRSALPVVVVLHRAEFSLGDYRPAASVSCAKSRAAVPVSLCESSSSPVNSIRYAQFESAFDPGRLIRSRVPSTSCQGRMQILLPAFSAALSSAR